MSAPLALHLRNISFFQIQAFPLEFPASHPTNLPYLLTNPFFSYCTHKFSFFLTQPCAGAAQARANVLTLAKGLFPNFFQFSAPTKQGIQGSGVGAGRDATGKRCSPGGFPSLLVFGCFNFPIALLCFFLPFHHFSAFKKTCTNPVTGIPSLCVSGCSLAPV